MSKQITSPITKGKATKYCIKAGVQYYQCVDTKTLFTGSQLDNSNMVGGTGEEHRNYNEHNETRYQRVVSLGGSSPMVLDYGCGTGKFVDYLKAKGIRALGFDKFSEDFNTPIVPNTFDVVTCIEVIEHLYRPFREFDQIAKALKQGGKLYIESSFSDWVNESHPYLNPEIGHQTIFSHQGLKVVLESRGFKELPAINPNVRIFEKI